VKSGKKFQDYKKTGVPFHRAALTKLRELRFDFFFNLMRLEKNLFIGEKTSRTQDFT
jgi:hypothetical protein